VFRLNSPTSCRVQSFTTHGRSYVQRSGWLAPQVALSHTWVGETSAESTPYKGATSPISLEPLLLLLLLLLLYNEFWTVIHLIEWRLNGCSEIVDKSLGHEQQRGIKWWMHVRLKPCSGMKTSAPVIWRSGVKEIYVYSSSITWPSLCGGEGLKPFCPEKFVVYKSDLGKCGDLRIFFLKQLVSYTRWETVKGPGEGGSNGGLLVLGGSTITTTNVIRLTDSLKLIQHLHIIYDPSLQKDSRENKMCTRISRFIQSVLCSAPTELRRKFHPNIVRLI
jgi:hypothetical protein